LPGRSHWEGLKSMLSETLQERSHCYWGSESKKTISSLMTTGFRH
jgi:hypothetical protein